MSSLKLQESATNGEPVSAAGSPSLRTGQRLVSIDALRGLVMLIMLVDHVRETVYLHHQVADPVAAETTSPALFFTRLLSGYCAPAFIILAGMSAWLYGQRHSSKEVSRFLLTRGLFLVLLELLVVGPAWTGIFPPEKFYLQVIWCIGLCMIALAGIIHLPRLGQWSLAIFLIAGHHLFDGAHAHPSDWWHPLWAILHQRDWIEILGTPARTSYPVLPWIGVITLGYLMGPLFRAQLEPSQRMRKLFFVGVAFFVGFLVIRSVNIYGDHPWRMFPAGGQTLMSYLALTKYPPSLLFLLFTLAPTFWALAAFEKRASDRIVSSLSRFGSAPLFFYILHLYLLKALYVILVTLFGTNQGSYYGVDHVWGIWLWSIALTPLLYLATCRFADFKKRRRDLKWLRYF